MITMKNLAIIIMFIACLSCKKEEEAIYDSTGISTKLPHVWNTAISDDEKQLASTVLRCPILFENDEVLVGAVKNKGLFIYAVNPENGKVDWEWNDLLTYLLTPNELQPLSINADDFYQKDNLLFFMYSTSSYIIDLKTGLTVSKYKVPLSRIGGRVTGIDNYFFNVGCDYYKTENEKLYIGSFNPTQKEENLLLPSYTPIIKSTLPERANTVGAINNIITFKEGNQDYIIFTIRNPISPDSPSGTNGVIELNLYNLTKKDWVYQKMPVRTSGKSIGGFDLIYKDKQIYFMSSDYVYCHNAQTGDEKWATLIGSAPLTSRMTLQNNRLYAACEDRFLYCLDINTGQVLWKEQNTGTCSPISYLNGVLYYLGGGDGKLHAVDANTGKHLWKLNSPDVTKNLGAFFYGVCATVPGKNGQKGRVIGTTGLNAYCFEAIR